MIRICKSPKRKPEVYVIIAIVLINGIDSICVNNCDICPWKNVCTAVLKAADYALKLAESK